jgi:tyrosyl-tRNA synthetase
LRDIGKYFTVNDLIKRDIIKKRLDTPDESISYTEFTYSLLQGYDFMTLYEKYGCDLQIGASDQWTNMLSGTDLIHKRLQKDAYVLAMPLITDASGKKFGKSEGNAVWLDAVRTSPFQFYQFWLNIRDADVEKYLKVYTFMSLTDIEALMEKHRNAPGEREAQETLARVVTEIVHGPSATAAVVAATDALFGTTPFGELSNEARLAALGEASSLKISKKELSKGAPLIDILVSGGVASSKGDARRLIEGKAITLNGLPILNTNQEIYLGDVPSGFGLIRKGKREVLILVLK